MEKDFLLYKQALELKELGFDGPCLKWFMWRDKGDYQCVSDLYDFPIDENGGISAPLYQQAFRWFRDNHGLRIRNYGSINYSKELSEYFEVFKYGYGTSDKSLSIVVGALTYEEAELECLKKLIEIVKEK